MIMKRIIYLPITFLFFVVLLSGCAKVLDKQNLGQISGNIVWDDENLINAYVNEIYAEFQQNVGWLWNDDNDSFADDAGWGNNITHGTIVSYGQITPDNDPLDYWPYATIHKMNDFFGNINTPPLDTAL